MTVQVIATSNTDTVTMTTTMMMIMMIISQGMSVRSVGKIYNAMEDVYIYYIGCFCRTAIFYNVVSSVFAVFGLFAGLLLGSQEGLSSWLLSATVSEVMG